MENAPVTEGPSTTDFDVANRNDAPEDAESRDAALVEAELLIEEISIDGMCGVY